MTKKSLIFACQWNKKKERTWSGTSYSIYKSLEKLYIIENFKIKESIVEFLLRHLYRFIVGTNKRTLEIYTIKKNNRIFSKRYMDDKVDVFQFSECPITSKTINHIYIDLSISYLLYIKKNEPEFFKYTEYDKTSIKNFYIRLKQQNDFFSTCKNIFTMSKWLRDFLIDIEHIDSNKVHYVGAGINVDLDKRDNKNKSRNKILFVGRNFSRKGGHLVYNALRILRDEFGLELELHIAGPKHNPIKGNMDGVKFWGDITEERLTNLYNICDILCVPSYFEAYGLVFSEALCFGLPCIGRNVYAMPERIEHGKTGYLMDGDEPLILANHIKNLFEDHAIFDEVETKREYYKIEYSWDKVAERIAQYMDR